MNVTLTDDQLQNLLNLVAFVEREAETVDEIESAIDMGEYLSTYLMPAGEEDKT